MANRVSNRRARRLFALAGKISNRRCYVRTEVFQDNTASLVPALAQRYNGSGRFKP